MIDITELIAELMPVFEDIIAMSPNNIQELESHTRKIATQLGAKIMKLKLEYMDKELNNNNNSSSSAKKNICKCRASSVHNRKRHKQILSTFGKVDIERTMSQCARCGQTRFALDEAMQIEPYTRVTPMLKKLSLLCAASWSYKMARDVLYELLGTDDVISTEEIEKLSMEVAKDIEEKQEKERKDLRFEYRERVPSRIYIDVDGGMVNSWDEEERMEGKSAVVWSKKIKIKSRNEIADKFYAGTFNNYRELVRKIRCELNKRVGSRIQEVELVLRGDGANWIRQMKKDYFQRALYVLDWYHLVKKIDERLDQAIEDEALREGIEKELKDLVYEGKVEEAIDKLEGLKSKVGVEGEEAIEKLMGYINRNREGIWYKEARERGIDIGAGTAEKAVDLVICRRFKQRGMICTRAGANALVKIRLLVLNNAWNQYWDYKLAA
jgi:hypothetical protein